MPPLMAAQVTTFARSSLPSIFVPKGVYRESLNPVIEDLCKAVCTAWATWQSTVILIDVMIQGPVAIGGKLVGPPIEPLIKANASPGLKQFINPVAGGIQEQLTAFSALVKVPGLPWYPSFSAVPGPVAPPTPNLPCPLLVIAPGGSLLGRIPLKQAMVNRLPLPRPLGSEAVCEAIAAGIDMAVQLWLSSTIVTNVMGTGPVPNWAPPYVPVGTVTAGLGIQIPGGMA